MLLDHNDTDDITLTTGGGGVGNMNDKNNTQVQKIIYPICNYGFSNFGLNNPSFGNTTNNNNNISNNNNLAPFPRNINPSNVNFNNVLTKMNENNENVNNYQTYLSNIKLENSPLEYNTFNPFADEDNNKSLKYQLSKSSTDVTVPLNNNNPMGLGLGDHKKFGFLLKNQNNYTNTNSTNNVLGNITNNYNQRMHSINRVLTGKNVTATVTSGAPTCNQYLYDYNVNNTGNGGETTTTGGGGGGYQRSFIKIEPNSDSYDGFENQRKIGMVNITTEERERRVFKNYDLNDDFWLDFA